MWQAHSKESPPDEEALWSGQRFRESRVLDASAASVGRGGMAASDLDVLMRDDLRRALRPRAHVAELEELLARGPRARLAITWVR